MWNTFIFSDNGKITCTIMCQPLSPFSFRAKVMVQLDKTPYHSIIVGPHILLSNSTNMSSANIETAKLSTINMRAISVFDSFVEGCKWVNRMKFKFKLNKAKCGLVVTSKFTHSFSKVIVISHKTPISAEIIASKFKNLSKIPLKNVVFRKMWCLTQKPIVPWC